MRRRMRRRKEGRGGGNISVRNFSESSLSLVFTFQRQHNKIRRIGKRVQSGNSEIGKKW